MKKYTIDDILTMRPCDPPYDHEYLEKLADGKTQLTALEILRKRIPPEDKLWVGIKMLTLEQQREFACWCALSVIHLWDAPKVVIQYLETQDESIRDAAMAAWDAAWDAAWVERAAERAAARAAIWGAAQTAAWDAARAAAATITENAVIKKQIAKIRKMLKAIK